MYNAIGVIVVVVALAAIVTCEGPCPPGGVYPGGCWCLNDNTIYCPGPYVGHWDMKETFQAISDGINDDSAVMDDLILSGHYLTTPQHIEAETMTRLKVNSLHILSDMFFNIHPEAFSGTHQHTKMLHIENHVFSDPIYAAEFFDKFVAVTGVQVLNSHMPTISDQAFAHMSLVEGLHFTSCGVESIGDFAFRELDNLVMLGLDWNNFTAESISKKAFAAMSPKVFISAERNEYLLYLPEDMFKEFLDNTVTGGLYVSDFYQDPRFFLHCDERVNWICANTPRYKAVLFGYQCREQEYDDVFKYCESVKTD